MKKLLSIIATTAVLLNSVVAPVSVLAQEMTPTPEPTPEATATPEATPTPEETVAPTNTPTVTPSETVTPTPEVTVVPQETATPEPTVEATTTPTTSSDSQSTPSQDQQISSPTSTPVISATATPTSTPNPEDDANVSVSLVTTNLFPETVQQNSIVQLITDKLDYSPTEMAVITGSGFEAGKTYNLTVSSSDDPTTSTTSDITTDDSGSFTYNYQLDGNYRPNYSVVVKDGEVVVATTSFTDSRTINTITVNGGSSVSVTAGSTISVGVNVITDGGNPSWQSTSYTIEGQGTICVNTANHTTAGTYTETFSIVAPSVNGTYDLNVTAYSKDTDCNGGSNSMTLNNAITVGNINVSNPSLSQSCGLDIAIILDNSTSIDSSEMTQMKNAVKAFTNALNGTPTQFSVTHFASSATIDQNFTSDVATVNSKIDSIPVGGGYTNWEEGFTKGKSTLPNRTTNPDLVIFASDGNPNTVIGGYAGGASESTAVNAAQVVANSIKSGGARILAIGIGSDLNTANMEAVSGTNVNSSSILDSDVVTTNFSTLATQLATFASQTCGGKISFNKYVDGTPKSDGQTWTFKIDGTTTITTDTDGKAVSGTLNVGNHSVSEPVIPSGYSYDHTTCTKDGVSTGTTDSLNNGVKDIPINSTSIFVCNFYNTKDTGSLTVKKVTSDGSSSGQWTMHINKTGQNDVVGAFSGSVTGSSFTLPAGTYSVTESGGPTGYSPTYSSDCPAGVVTLTKGSSKICTITNTAQTAALTLNKTVNNSGAGSKTASDFKAYIDGNLVSWGVANTVATNVQHIVTEGALDHYTPSIWGTDCSSDGKITLTPGQNKNCSITNTYVPYCGDTHKDSNEQCDGTDGVSQHYLCTASCTLQYVPYCGDNLINQATEECDGTNLGSYSSTDFKCNSCKVELIDPDIDICHSTGSQTNPYVTQSPSKSGDVDGHDGHTGPVWYPGIATGWGDIIPPFSYVGGSYAGKNWTLEGQAIFNNGCKPQNGTLTVKKVVSGSSQSSSSWTIHIKDSDGKEISSFPGNAGGVNVNLMSGIYSVTETGPEDYSLTYSGCDSNGNISVNPNQTSTCILTNTRDTGTLQVLKNVDLNGDGDYSDPGETGATDWQWQYNNGADHNTGDTAITVPTGTYALSETDKPGFHMERLSCTGGTLNLSTVTVNKGTNVICTFENARNIGSIKVTKIIDADGNLQTTDDQTLAQNWQFTVEGNGPNTNSAVSHSTDSNGLSTFGQLMTGNYKVTETQQDGYSLVDVSCFSGNLDGNTVYNVNVTKGNEATCTFYNSPNGTIHGYKWSDKNQNMAPDVDEELLSGWTINLYKWNGESFDSAPIRTMVTDSSQSHLGWYWFEHLFPGKYEVCEVGQDGWIQTYPINDNNNCHIVNLPDGNSGNMPVGQNYVAGPEYNFGNVEKGSVVVYKYNDLNGNGVHDTGEPFLSDWQMSLTPETGEVLSQSTGESGNTEFTLKPAIYTLSETQKEGWYQSGITCTGSGTGVQITANGEAYGHHGACSGWNTCGDAATCAKWACEINGYSNLVSYGDAKPCTEFQSCNLFYGNQSSDGVQMNWSESYGGGCPVMGVTDIVCSNQAISSNSIRTNNAQRLTVVPGETQTCYVGNYQKAKLTVTKDVLDAFGNKTDDNTPFTVSVTGQDNQNFSELSPATFNLSPGTYTVSEINIDPSYILKSDNDISVTVSSGQNTTVNFTNWQILPQVSITKTNDSGSGVHAGSTITYTLTVKNTGTVDLNNIKVTDILPGGFTYVTGSTGGDITADPTISGSVLAWDVQGLESGKSLVITYKAAVSSELSDGTYTNFATCKAIYKGEKSVDCNESSSDVAIGSTFGYSGNLGGQVLGASTELPDTGSPTILVVIGFGLLITGIGLNIVSKKKYAKK